MLKDFKYESSDLQDPVCPELTLEVLVTIEIDASDWDEYSWRFARFLHEDTGAELSFKSFSPEDQLSLVERAANLAAAHSHEAYEVGQDLLADSSYAEWRDK